jgi:hypothetical protein
METLIDQTTGEVYAYSQDDGGLEVSDVTGFLGGLLGLAGGPAGQQAGSNVGEQAGNWLEDLIGIGGGGRNPDAGGQGQQQGGGMGQLPPLPGQGDIGLPGGGIQGGGAGNVDMGGVIGQILPQLVSYFANKPDLFRKIGRRLGIIKGSEAHERLYLTPGCTSELVKMLPKSKRIAVKQFMCGFPDAMGDADEDTFLALVIGCSGKDPAICECD